ncbi:beta-ketoacyl synthase N-terminal-like domain-containing protein [Nocardia sp. CA-135953]|uniref:beta-ketoacyl synthase N-terminal-like domain-containing protein n=1 Tax=Nocardia sp. CA-135953 TaxID=3239978 RepID=UPI003D96F41A
MTDRTAENALPVGITGVGVASDRHDTVDQLLLPDAPRRADAADRLRRELGRGFRYKDQATKLGVLAAIRALSTAAHDQQPDTGIVVSSNFGNLQTVCDAARLIRTEGVAATSPMDLPNASSNVIASTIAIHLGLRGPNLTVCNGAPAGLDALRWAMLLIRARRARRVVVVGVESATEAAAALQSCAPSELFEGAAAVVVEPLVRETAAVVVRHCGRGTDEKDAVTKALAAAADPPVDLWLGTQIGSAGTVLDVETYLGRASGALGVLQCAVAAQWLGTGGRTAVAVAGGDDEGAAATVLTHAEPS